jgi:hypothetical protein
MRFLFWHSSVRGGQIFASIAGLVDGMTVLLTDNEVLYLGILSVLPNAGDTHTTMDGFFVFGHLEVEETHFVHKWKHK